MGALVGGAIITSGVTALRWVQAGAPPPSDIGFHIVTVSACGGLGGAAVTAWLRSGGIPDPWRRSVIAALAGFGAVLLAVPAMFADKLAGRSGLVAYLVLLIAALAALARAPTPNRDPSA